MSTDKMELKRAPRGALLKKALAVVSTLALSLGLVTATTVAANALPSGITAATVVDPGPPLDTLPAGTTINEGKSLRLEVDYNLNAKGQTYPFQLGPGATLGGGVPTGTDAVKSYTLVDSDSDGVDDTIIVEFHDDPDWPELVQGGTFGFDFTVDEALNGDEDRDIVWTIAGEPQSLTIRVRDLNYVPPVTVPDTIDKALIGGGNLNTFVQMAQTGVDGNYVFTGLGDGILSHNIQYRLTVNIPDGQIYTGYSIADQLPPGLQYVGAGETVVGAGDAVATTATLTQYQPGGVGGLPAATVSTPLFAPAVGADGGSFAGAIDLTGPATLIVAYSARVTDKALFEGHLSTSFGNMTSPNTPRQTFAVPDTERTNTATFGPDDRKDTAAFTLTGTIPGPCGANCNDAFGKTSDWGAGQRNFSTDVNGVIDNGGAEVVYSLRANLERWDNRNSNYSLQRNVLITDTLTEQAEWKTAESNFISMTGTSSDFTGLTAFAGVCDATTMSLDAQIGTYCVDDQTLYVNVGKNAQGVRGTAASHTNVTVIAKAQLLKLDEPLVGNGPAGLHETGTSSVLDATAYRYRNTGFFTYFDGTNGTVNRNADIFPVKLPQDRTQGLNDTNAFTKAGPADEVHANTGQAAIITYRITVKTGTTAHAEANLVAEDVHIVDVIDLSVFPLDPANLTAAGGIVVEGEYASADLDADDFALSLVGDQLNIVLSTSGKTKVSGQPADRDLIVDLTLTTRVLEANDTIDVVNRAQLIDSTGDVEYWSEFSGSATSWGNEVEAQKRVWDSAVWSPFLKTAADESGRLIQRNFAYQIELRGHGSYNSAYVPSVVDELPANVEFLGFIVNPDPASWLDPQPGDYVVGPVAEGDFEAAYDLSTHTVTLTQVSGRFPVGGRIPFRFLVRVIDDSPQIVNTLVGGPSVVIEGISTPGVDIQKWIDEGEVPQYDATGAITNDGFAGDYDDPTPFTGKVLTAGQAETINFTVSNDGPDRLIDVTVSDELTAGTVGAIENLLCTFPDGSTGTFWAGPMELATQFSCTGTLPALQIGEVHANMATVTATGEVNGNTVSDWDAWHGYVKSWAVGDYTWIDSNKNGMQDPGEPVLPGVGVELLDGNGQVVATTTTDINGLYKFDLLPAGSYQVRFTLTDEQAKIYIFTEPEAGNAAFDSDARVTGDPRVGTSALFVLDDTNQALSTQYADQTVLASQGIDPTWDAGVVLKSYAVGDYTWIDSNNNGIQDSDEPVLPGVGVELLDENGDVVSVTTTDINGFYKFDMLPAGTYQVRFTLTDEQAYIYAFTQTASGNPANDSDAHVTNDPAVGTSAPFVLDDTNQALTTQYPGVLASQGIDPTWDAGVIVKTFAVGDYTWIDKNRDGIQDDGEPVLPGVGVELLDENGTVVATTTTDNNGRYIFDELPPGTYQIRFTLTEEQGKRYRYTTLNAGTVGNDSNAIVTSDPRVAFTEKFVLDSSNAQLTTVYAPGYRSTEGIDPTWDAGVWEDPSLLASTGADRDLAWVGFGAGALLLFGAAMIGAALIVTRRRRETSVE